MSGERAGEGEARERSTGADAAPTSASRQSHRASRSSEPDAWDDAPPDDVVALTRAEAQHLFGADVSRPSRVTPLRVVGAQCLLTLCAMAVWAMISARPLLAALSAGAGGLICCLPSGLFAAHLRQRGRDSVGAWMLAEGIKLGLTIAMFIAVAMYFKDVRWLALLVTYVLALKTYWLALAWR